MQSELLYSLQRPPIRNWARVSRAIIRLAEVRGNCTSPLLFRGFPVMFCLGVLGDEIRALLESRCSGVWGSNAEDSLPPRFGQGLSASGLQRFANANVRVAK